MPFVKSKSPTAFSDNLAKELAAVKPKKQMMKHKIGGKNSLYKALGKK